MAHATFLGDGAPLMAYHCNYPCLAGLVSWRPPCAWASQRPQFSTAERPLSASNQVPRITHYSIEFPRGLIWTAILIWLVETNISRQQKDGQNRTHHISNWWDKERVKRPTYWARRRTAPLKSTTSATSYQSRARTGSVWYTRATIVAVSKT